MYWNCKDKARTRHPFPQQGQVDEVQVILSSLFVPCSFVRTGVQWTQGPQLSDEPLGHVQGGPCREYAATHTMLSPRNTNRRLWSRSQELISDSSLTGSALNYNQADCIAWNSNFQFRGLLHNLWASVSNRHETRSSIDAIDFLRCV